MIRPALALLTFLLPVAMIAQGPLGGDPQAANLPPLDGSIQGDTYFAPSGAYSVTIPVFPELGGTVTDNSIVATFRDPYSTLISIGSIPMDATQRWKLETNGIKDYLKDFFVNYVARDFFKGNPRAKIDENARFVPSFFGGAFITYITLPGGSMFFNPEFQIAPLKTLPVAKRANMVFVKNGYVFVISTELAERVTEGTAYHSTDAEENEILRNRLIDVSRKIHFLKTLDSK